MIKIDEGLKYTLISKEFKIIALYNFICKILKIYRGDEEINRFDLEGNRLAGAKVFILIKKMKRSLKKKLPTEAGSLPT